MQQKMGHRMTALPPEWVFGCLLWNIFSGDVLLLLILRSNEHLKLGIGLRSPEILRNLGLVDGTTTTVPGYLHTLYESN